jgi:hypothetical protein
MMTRSSGVLVVATIAALTGCAHGPIRGQLALPDRAAQSATLNYKSSMFGKTGKLTSTLPTGETFTGPYTLDPLAPDKSILSTLAGDRGNNMVCRMRLNEPGIGPDSGGSVRCEISTGGTFVANF